MRLYLRGEIAETKLVAEIICFRHKVILLKCSSARIEKARNKLILGICALIDAGLTAFYMTRMMLMTWYGKRRWEAEAHPHESPAVMTWR